jgi:hypothetical protein
MYAVHTIGAGEFAVQCQGSVRLFRGPLLGRAAAISHLKQLIGSPAPATPIFDPSVWRQEAMAVAQVSYAEQGSFKGNASAGMRALGSAMNVIQSVGPTSGEAEFKYQLLANLAALGERCNHDSADHERARVATAHLVWQLRKTWSGKVRGDEARPLGR